MLYVIAAWVGVSVLAYFVVLPLLAIAKRADRTSFKLPRGLAHPSADGVPSPQRLGYSGVVLQRLVEHTRTVIGVHSACLAIAPPGSPTRFTAVAAAGMDEDVIGRRYADACGELGGLASAAFSAEPHASGVVCIADPVDGRALEPLDSELLAELAELAADVLRHHARRELSSGDSRAEISGLVKALADSDGDTYRHSLEVAATARAVGERIGLRGADLVEVELAALLHDVGKLRLPASILHKAGPLEPPEQQLIRLHPHWSAEMVAAIPGLEAVAMIVKLHHERPDGSGYPYGLSSERLPIASRIVSACDAYGAMTKGRSYRDPLDVDAALSELELNAGSQFDPLVVDVLADFVREPVAVAA